MARASIANETNTNALSPWLDAKSYINGSNNNNDYVRNERGNEKDREKRMKKKIEIKFCYNEAKLPTRSSAVAIENGVHTAQIRNPTNE